MINESEQPQESQDGKPGAQKTANSQEETSNIRAGALQEDQLEKLDPGNESQRKNSDDRLGHPPVSHVENGDNADNQYPTDEQKWPENKIPTK